jgi:two-component system response regulator AtoC
MPPALQAKLLRFLQDNMLERLGSNRRIPLDIRIIAATNRNPREAVQDGHLREDLFYRLNVFPINLAPLREHKDDIASLATHFVAKHGGRSGAVSAAVIAHLQAYDWPGNVRELENMVERALVLCGSAPLGTVHFPLENATSPGTAPPVADGAPLPGPLAPAVEALEAAMIEAALAQAQGSKQKAAALLDISERALWYKVKKYWPKDETE